MVIYCLAAICLSANASAATAASLTANNPITSRLAQDDTQSYSIMLPANTFVYGELNQIDFDGKVTVKAPSGAVVKVFDYLARGSDPIDFTTNESGVHTFNVDGYQGQHGRFTLTLQKAEPVANTPEQRLTQLLMPYSGKDTPGAIVAIVKDGAVVHHQAVGMASLGYQVPFTRSTISNVGSVAKQFTAFAVVKLASQGLLSLDDDVRQYFPSLPDLGHVVTIRHLLNHTSGLREYMNLLYMSGRRIGEGDYIDRAEVISLLENQQVLQDEPGTRYNYNNSGYSLAAMIIEQVTKQPFQIWMVDNIYAPLAMSNTVQKDHAGQIIPRAAQGYDGAKTAPYKLSIDIGGGGGAVMGAGGLYSTVDDLAKWLGNFSSTAATNKAIIEQLFEPTIPEPGENIFYGLGVGISNYKGLTVISHQGADNGYRAMMFYFPALNAGIIAMSNNAMFNPYLVESVADAFFAEHLSNPAPHDTVADAPSTEFDHTLYQQFDGQYEVIGYPGVMYYIWSEPDGMFSMRPNREPRRLTSLSNDRFQLNANTVYQFNRDENGVVTTLRIIDGANLMAKRLEQWQPSPNELPQFVGRYYSDEINTSYQIELVDNHLTAHHPRIGKMALIPKTADTFSANDALSQVRFVRDDAGQITGFMASDIRTLNVWFEKQICVAIKEVD